MGLFSRLKKGNKSKTSLSGSPSPSASRHQLSQGQTAETLQPTSTSTSNTPVALTSETTIPPTGERTERTQVGSVPTGAISHTSEHSSPVEIENIPRRSTSLRPDSLAPEPSRAGLSNREGAHHLGSSITAETGIPTARATSTVGPVASEAPQHRDGGIAGTSSSLSTDIAAGLSSLAISQDVLVQQRQGLAEDIAAQIRDRRGKATSLSEEGQAVFEAAGLPVKTQGSVEVNTRWMKPVVQEIIIPREHTEITTVIEKEIHRHHIYPKIQPIADPDPIRLQPRHRIFSAVTGKWHEVTGDAAAIEILGEDAFYNGKKEVRESRAMALPGFGEVASMSREDRERWELGGLRERSYSYESVPEERTLGMAI